MKFVVALTVAAVFVSLLALTSSEMMLASGRASAVALTCPVTLPTLKVKAGAGFGPAGFNFGNRHLRAELWPHGQLVAGRLPGVGFMATVSPVGSIHAKQGWWRGVSGKLTISGRRLGCATASVIGTRRLRLDRFPACRADRLNRWVLEGGGQNRTPSQPYVRCESQEGQRQHRLNRDLSRFHQIASRPSDC
jgi:hypothetical protein